MTVFEPILVQQDWNSSSDRDWSEVVADFPIFAELGKRELRKIVRHARFAEFSPGEAVVLKGGPVDSFYVVLGGEAEVRGTRGSRLLHAGDYFGELALIGGASRSATVAATKELHVMRLPGKVFLELVNGNPGVALTIARELGHRLRQANAATQPQPS